jgi:hypothetical protein
MGSPRENHTATLLTNGMVLVAGGVYSYQVYPGSDAYIGYILMNSAELYDPSNKTWTETGPMSTPRENHTATLLPNGQVLVTGGFGDNGALSSAELYDPATRTWTETNLLNSARSGHTATLLPNVQVLVAGGLGNGNFPSSSAELSYWCTNLTAISAKAVADAKLYNYASDYAPSLSQGQISLDESTFTFNINNGMSNTYWNEYESSDLVNWTLVGGVTLGSSGSGSFTDSNVSGVAHRFYKLNNGTNCSQLIGFTRVTVGPGPETCPGTNALIANQLDAPVNTLDGLFNIEPNHTMPDGSSLPAGSEIEKWNSGGFYDIYTWNGTDWGGNGSVTLAPGEGAFLVIPTNNPPVTVTFVGSVREGQLTIPLPQGCNMVSLMLPEAGGIQSVLGYQPYNHDQVLFWNGNGFRSFTYVISKGNPRWTSEPVLNVGQAVFINTTTNKTWQVNYSPCQ